MVYILSLLGEMTSDYVPPFHTCVPADPSIEEMKKVVVLQKKHPVISESWLSDDVRDNRRKSIAKDEG